jgi:hypothetical protein
MRVSVHKPLRSGWGVTGVTVGELHDMISTALPLLLCYYGSALPAAVTTGFLLFKITKQLANCCRRTLHLFVML